MNCAIKEKAWRQPKQNSKQAGKFSKEGLAWLKGCRVGFSSVSMTVSHVSISDQEHIVSIKSKCLLTDSK